MKHDNDDVTLAAVLTHSWHSHPQADFDAKLEAAGDLLVLVDFHATWCGPCKMIAPKLEEFANKYVDKLVIVKVDHARLNESSVTSLC